MISLIGYMASGKSHISKLLSSKMDLKLYDSDREIMAVQKLSIAEIFEQKGELFFRKKEREFLEELFAAKTTGVLSLGGGTPAYFNNMELINDHSVSVFLRTSVTTLVQRLLLQKEKRPLLARISDEDLPEFIAKHLFERNPFYSKAQITVDTDGKTPDQIVVEIIGRLHC